MDDDALHISLPAVPVSLWQHCHCHLSLLCRSPRCPGLGLRLFQCGTGPIVDFRRHLADFFNPIPSQHLLQCHACPVQFSHQHDLPRPADATFPIPDISGIRIVHVLLSVHGFRILSSCLCLSLFLIGRLALTFPLASLAIFLFRLLSAAILVATSTLSQGIYCLPMGIRNLQGYDLPVVIEGDRAHREALIRDVFIPFLLDARLCCRYPDKWCRIKFPSDSPVKTGSLETV